MTSTAQAQATVRDYARVEELLGHPLTDADRAWLAELRVDLDAGVISLGGPLTSERLTQEQQREVVQAAGDALVASVNAIRAREGLPPAA